MLCDHGERAQLSYCLRYPLLLTTLLKIKGQVWDPYRRGEEVSLLCLPPPWGGALVWKSAAGSLSVEEGLKGQGLIWRAPGEGKCVSQGACRKASTPSGLGEGYGMARYALSGDPSSCQRWIWILQEGPPAPATSRHKHPPLSLPALQPRSSACH